MATYRLAPDRKIPKDLATFSELSKFISENSIKLFSREDNPKYDIINYHFEQKKIDDAFFIIDLGEILEQYKQWNTLLPRVKPFYATKCCSDPMVIKTLGVLGCGFACSSKTEIISVTDSNVSANRIIYANPVKDPQHIKFARSQNIDTLTFDNEVELYKIKLYHPYAKLVLRIKVDESKSTRSISKFGCPLSEVNSVLEKARSLDLNVIGVNVHLGHRNRDLSNYTAAIKDAREVFRLGEALGMRMYILDIGGGFPGSSAGSLLSFEDIARTMNDAIDKYFEDIIQDIKIYAEPGRYFVTKSHTLVFNVIGIKKISEENGDVSFQYYMNDGIYGSFNCIIFDGADPRICAFNNKSEKKYRSTLFGPTCDNMDIITRSIELPELGVGEWCYVEDFGAYTQACSSDFNGFTPAESNYVFMY